jgi:type I restriction enzyme S subunit
VKIIYDKLDLKYLFHKLSTLQLTDKKQDGGVPGINRNNVYKIQIPVPPLAEQERIVAILDKFDALVNGTTPSPNGATPPLEGNLSASLPAELNARRRQYEYYRDKLLTFKKYNSPPLEGWQSKTDGVVS